MLHPIPPAAPPRAGSWIDHYYWYHGTKAMRLAGGKDWPQWRQALRDAVLPNQRDDRNFMGSWDPEGAWGPEGGRVYSTAILTLALLEGFIEE